MQQPAVNGPSSKPNHPSTCVTTLPPGKRRPRILSWPNAHTTIPPHLCSPQYVFVAHVQYMEDRCAGLRRVSWLLGDQALLPAHLGRCVHAIFDRFSCLLELTDSCDRRYRYQSLPSGFYAHKGTGVEGWTGRGQACHCDPLLVCRPPDHHLNGRRMC